MTAAGSLFVRSFLSKNMKAPSRLSSRKYSAMVVAIVLLPDPARPCSHRMFWPGEGVVSQSVIHFMMSCRVPGKHSGRENPSMPAGLSCFRCSMSTEIVASVPDDSRIAQHALHIPNSPTFSNALVETKTAWIILPESNDCLRPKSNGCADQHFDSLASVAERLFQKSGCRIMSRLSAFV